MEIAQINLYRVHSGRLNSRNRESLALATHGTGLFDRGTFMLRSRPATPDWLYWEQDLIRRKTYLACLIAALALLPFAVQAKNIYKYQDENGIGSDDTQRGKKAVRETEGCRARRYREHADAGDDCQHYHGSQQGANIGQRKGGFQRFAPAC